MCPRPARRPVDKVGSFLTFAIYNPQNWRALLAAWREELTGCCRASPRAEPKDAPRRLAAGRWRQPPQDRERLSASWRATLTFGRTLRLGTQLEEGVAALTVADVNAAVKR